MKQKILNKLFNELETAEEKEELAEKEYELSQEKEEMHKYVIKYAEFTKAIGYVNGLMEAIDIVSRIKEED